MGLELGHRDDQVEHGATAVNQRELGYERRGLFSEAKEERQML